MKTCYKCKTEKPLDEFNKCSRSKDGKQQKCKECQREWRQKNKDSIKARKKEYWKKNKEVIKGKRKEYFKEYNLKNKEKQKKYREENKDRKKETDKKYRLKNQDKLKEKKKEYYNKNKVSILEKQKEWRQEKKEIKKQRDKKYREKNKEKLIAKKKEYYNKNKERITKSNLEYSRGYRVNRRKTDPLYRMTCNLRSRTVSAFRKSRWIKNSSNVEMLGCTYEEAFKHIEKQFKEGMSWDNHSFNGWHIDHIIPLASAKTEEELKSLCHYTNLQPLWAEDNLSKGAKIID